MGKTKMIKEIIRKMRSIQPWLNVYHLDTKRQGDFTGIDGTMWYTEKPPPVFTGLGQSMVWQPYSDDLSAYSDFFTNILRAGKPAIVNIDEAINMRDNNRIPRGLSILCAQGRMPGISVMAGTQEVARAPRQLRSQASHILTLNLNNEYDERIMKSHMRMYDKGSKLDLRKYQAWYIRPDIDDVPIFISGYEKLLDYIK
jgi:hypothetical protein